MPRWTDTRLQTLFGIEHPVVQGGMIWNAGAKLAAAVSNAGGLGLVGAGSMQPDVFRAQVRKARDLTARDLTARDLTAHDLTAHGPAPRPFGVNLPLLYPHVAECLDIALAEGVRIFFTSAGSPKKVALRLKEAGAVVVHVVATPELAVKCEQAGCDAVVCEGFEAGGHNGREELTTLVLVPECVRAVSIPVIAAGGIATGAQLVAALALGAAGVQVGSRFAVTQESSGHDAFKQAVVAAGAGDTHLVLKGQVPVRLLRNAFRDRITRMEARGASRDELAAELGHGRARRGMHEGDLDEGELEIGQVAGLIDDVPTAAEVMRRLLDDADRALARLAGSPGRAPAGPAC